MSDSKLQKVAEEINEIAKQAADIFGNTAGSLAQELAVAEAMVKLEERLTQEVMQPIMALMNTRIGFRIDAGRGPGRFRPTDSTVRFTNVHNGFWKNFRTRWESQGGSGSWNERGRGWLGARFDNGAGIASRAS